MSVFLKLVYFERIYLSSFYSDYFKCSSIRLLRFSIHYFFKNSNTIPKYLQN